MIFSTSSAVLGDTFQHLLFTQIWQVALLAIAVGLIARWFASDRPHLAHALWVLVLIKCITPPVLASPISPFTWMAEATAPQIPDASDSTPPASQPSFSTTPVLDDDSPAGQDSLPPVVVHVKRPAEAPQIQKVAAPTISQSTQSRPQNSETRTGLTCLTWVVWLWAVGVLIALVAAIIRWLLFYKWIQRQRCDNALERELETTWLEPIQQQIGLSRPVRLMMTDSLVGPAVMGIWNPTVLIPRLLVDIEKDQSESTFTSENLGQHDKQLTTLTTLLAHELVHIRRGDLWWALLQTLAGCLFWFHPLVWWACRKVTQESERSCDEETIAALNCSPVDYAKNLIEVLEWKHRLKAAPVVPGIRPIDITTARLERVMKLENGCNKRTPWSTWLVLALSCCLALPGAAMGLRAQEQPNESAPNATATKPRDVAVEQGSVWILNHQTKEGSWWQKIDGTGTPDQDPKSSEELKTKTDSDENNQPLKTQVLHNERSLPSKVRQATNSWRQNPSRVQYFVKGPEFKLTTEPAGAHQAQNAGQTGSGTQENDEAQLKTYHWSIPKILELASQRTFPNSMTPEQAIVTYFSNKWGTTASFTLTDNQLSVTTTAEQSKAIELLLTGWRKHGLDTVVTETRFFSILNQKELEALKLDWEVSQPIVSQTEQQNAIPLLANLPHVSPIYSNVETKSNVEKIGVDLETNENGVFQPTKRKPKVQSTAFTTGSYLSLHTFLDDKQVKSLVQLVRQTSENNVLQGPTTMTYLGQPSKIVDSVQRPFVTEFRRIDPSRPLSAKNLQPIVKLVNEGRTIKQKVTKNPDDSLSLDWGITIEAITDVDTIDMSLIGQGVALQQPRISTRTIKSKLKLPKNKNTVAFCYFEKDLWDTPKVHLVAATIRKVAFESLLNQPTPAAPTKRPTPKPTNRQLTPPTPLVHPVPYDYVLKAISTSEEKASSQEPANQSIAEWLGKSGFKTSVTGNGKVRFSNNNQLAEITGKKFEFYSIDRDQISLAADQGTLRIRTNDGETEAIEAELSGASKVRYEGLNFAADSINFQISLENNGEISNFELNGQAKIFSSSRDMQFAADRIVSAVEVVKEGEQPQHVLTLYGNASIQIKMEKGDHHPPMKIRGDNLRFLMQSSTFEAF